MTKTIHIDCTTPDRLNVFLNALARTRNIQAAADALQSEKREPSTVILSCKEAEDIRYALNKGLWGLNQVKSAVGVDKMIDAVLSAFQILESCRVQGGYASEEARERAYAMATYNECSKYGSD